MSVTCTICPYCGVGCGILATPEGEIAGDPQHPANFGRLCSKGAALADTIGLGGRLLHPRIAGSKASWDQALDLVAGSFRQAIDKHGPDSVAFYVSGQILTEDYYVANKLMKGFIGSANIDTNSRLCMASSVAGHKRAFGTDTVPGTYEDLELADLVVLVGSNLAWCHPVLYQRLSAAKTARPQMQVVVIDPRRTVTCDIADLHLAIKPDADIALFNGLLAEIDSRGAVNTAYATAHVNGLADTLATARDSDLDDLGPSPAQIDKFYDMWISTPKVVTVYSQGVNQSVCGTDKVNAIINTHLATGRIGQPGCGPFSVTGQPNAMGGREVGGLANMLACHLDIENPAHRQAVQSHWKSPAICDRPGLKAVDLFAACDRGEIKALWIIGTNPAVSLPDADFVAKAIAKVPFCAVSDVTETDTTALADVLLPATAWGEKTGTVTNSERRISLQRAFLPAPGSARPDWAILCDVACRMGWERGFSFTSPAEIFREYAALSGRAADLGRGFDISGLAHMSNDEYAAFEPVQWPVPHRARDQRFFAKGGFFHADGKARMLPIKSALGCDNPGDGLHLNTGRIRDQWHTMTRTGKSARLNAHHPEPFAEINPKDGARLGLENGTLVELSGLGNKAVVRAVLTENILSGQVFVPMHWSAANSAAGRVNVLVSPRCDPVSGQPALKGSRVNLRRLQERWHGFAASAVPMRPSHAYGALGRIETGWRYDFAGLVTPDDWETEARSVLNLPDGNASVLRDAARGIVRIAIHEGTRLRGLFFASPNPPIVAHQHIAKLINSELPAFAALIGLQKDRHRDPGTTICACFGVSKDTLCKAIENGAHSVDELGRHTSAGRNCGSCKPELQALIDSQAMQLAAE